LPVGFRLGQLLNQPCGRRRELVIGRVMVDAPGIGPAANVDARRAHDVVWDVDAGAQADRIGLAVLQIAETGGVKEDVLAAAAGDAPPGLR
jgi:hypothetical protein